MPSDDEGLPTIDYIYELLDDVQSDEQALQKGRHQYSGIYEAVSYLYEQGYGRRLGLSDMDLDKVLRVRGRFEASVLLKLASRTKALLREVEGELHSLSAKPISAASAEPFQTAPELTVPVVKWVPVRLGQNAELVAQISILLDEVITLARGTNLPPERGALTQLQRKQLVTILETTLAVLKAPLVEKGLLSKARDASIAGVNSGLQKGTELGMLFALKKLGELLSKLIGSV